MILKEERSTTPYKVSLRVTFRASKDKNGKETKAAKLGGDSSGGRYYYPASQDYGWIMRNGVHHEGLHFSIMSADEVSEYVKVMIVGEFDKVIQGVQSGTLTS